MRITANPKPKLKILVVEDDPDIQILLRTLLTRQGYQVEEVGSGLAALASFARSIPDLILLDLAMPDMDGLTFLKRRSQHERTKNIPVIVVSARDRNTDVMAAIENGASNYVTKPFDQVRLLSSIAKLLPSQEVEVSRNTRVTW